MSIICLCIYRFPWNLHQCFLFEKIFHGRCTIIQCCLFLQYVTRNFSDRTWVCLKNYNAYKRVQKHHRPFYTRHTKSGGVLCYTLRTLSVRPSVRPSSVRPSVCPSALRFRALTLVHFDLFSSNFALTLVSGRSGFGVVSLDTLKEVSYCEEKTHTYTLLWPL